MNIKKIQLSLLLLCLNPALVYANGQPNVLLFTADDLGYEVIGSTVEGIPDLTPALDRFAEQAFQFRNAHTNEPMCQPSRSNLATGKYSISSGMMGFFHMKQPTPTVMRTLGEAGYLTGILGKVKHSTPDMAYEWDFVFDYADLGAGRSPEKYYQHSTDFFALSKETGRPFYFMVNSHDPHRAFHDPENPMKNAAEPSRLFTTDDVVVPPYLPNIEQTRKELSQYYNSVRRLDDTFARVMKALEEAGLADNTLVMFMSDNGSAFPFAKANVYLAASRTPWLVRWPGQIRQGAIDTDHFISAIDFFPTVLEATGIGVDEKLDGKSFLPVLKGGNQGGREAVFTQVNYKIGGPAAPMRAVQDKKYAYIFNPWSREGANYRNSNEGDIIKAMEASGDPELLARVTLFRERTIEEFYDLESDPGSTVNLVKDPAYAEIVDRYRKRLREWMVEYNDPVLPMFDSRDDPEQIARLMETSYPSKKELMPAAQKEEIEARQREKQQQRAKNRKNSKENS